MTSTNIRFFLFVVGSTTHCVSLMRILKYYMHYSFQFHSDSVKVISKNLDAAMLIYICCFSYS